MRRMRVPLIAALLLLFAFTLLGCGSQPSAANGASAVPDLPQTPPTPGTVSATTHPLVAQYSWVAPSAGQVSVEFGTDVSYGRSTASQEVAAGGAVTLLVAGMRASTTYHMRARVDLGGGIVRVDSDHTFTTGALPQATFPAVTVTPPEKLPAGNGVDLVSSFGEEVGAVVLDTDGSILWYYYDPTLPGSVWPSPIRQLDNGDYLINFEIDVREVDLTGSIVRDVTLDQLNAALAAAGYSIQAASFSHDALRLSNGHWILLVSEYRSYQDLPGYPGTTPVLGDALVDLDANNQVAWVWDAFDHLDINRQPYEFPDWTHSNAIVYTSDGNLLLSVRHQSWILKIDYNDGSGSGDILWRLGPGGDFTLSSSDPAQWFYNQHFPLVLQTQGTKMQLALYDNGDIRPDSSGQECANNGTCYSRAITMNLDESALTAKVTWQYAPGWFSFWGGSIVELPNKDLEIDSSVVGNGNSRVIQITPGLSPKVVWQMDTSNSYFYRAYRIPSLYPGVQW